MTVKNDTRTEEQKTVDKLLLLYVSGKLIESGQEVTLDKIQNLVYIIQQTMMEHGFKVFHYTDWEWVDE